MKKFLSIFLVFALLFCFASCKAKDKDNGMTTTTTIAPPVIKEQTHHKDFTDENGRIVYSVDVVIPEISEYADVAVKDYLNKVSYEIFEDACDKAESNIKNAAYSMDYLKSEKPWTNRITFETTYSDGRFTCYLIKDALSYSGGVGEPAYITKCFDLKQGTPCSAAQFAIAEFSQEEYQSMLVDDLIKPMAMQNFYPNNPSAITEEQLGKFNELFSVGNFYLTDNGMAFYFDKSLIDPYLTGEYICEFDWSQLSTIFMQPIDIQTMDN